MAPAEKKDGVKPFDKKARVTVFATGITTDHKAGDELSVHPTVAARLVDSGKATETKGEKGKKGKKAEKEEQIA